MDYGEYHLKLTHGRYEEVEKKIVVDQPQVQESFKMELKRGVLSISGLSSNSKISIDGYDVRLEDNTARLPIGRHSVVISQSGYEKKAQAIRIQSGKKVTISGSLNRKTTGKALFRSLFIPGLGQAYQEKNTRKWIYPVVFLGTAAASYAMLNTYNTAVDDYNSIKEQYETAFSINDINSYREEMYSAYDDVETKEQTRNVMFMAVGAVWLWNVLDALILPPGYKINAGAYGHTPLQNGHTPLQVGIAINW
jgi:hypothetical protein